MAHQHRTATTRRLRFVDFLKVAASVIAMSVVAALAMSSAQAQHSRVPRIDSRYDDVDGVTRAVIYAGRSGLAYVKQSGEPFHELFETQYGPGHTNHLFVYHGTAILVTGIVSKQRYAIPRLPGSRLCEFVVEDGVTKEKWLPPGTDVMLRTWSGLPAATAVVWTGAGLRHVWYECTSDGTVRKDVSGRPVREERIVVERWVALTETRSTHSYGFADADETQEGMVRMDYSRGFYDSFALFAKSCGGYPAAADIPIDHRGCRIRAKPISYWGWTTGADGERKLETDPFVIASSLMDERVRLRKGQTVDLPVMVGPETAIQRFSYDGESVRSHLVRKSGATAVFPVNRDENGALQWARPGENTSYVRVDGFWYEKVYVLDASGQPKGHPTYFTVEWREDGSIYRGPEKFKGEEADAVVPDY